MQKISLLNLFSLLTNDVFIQVRFVKGRIFRQKIPKPRTKKRGVRLKLKKKCQDLHFMYCKIVDIGCSKKIVA